MRDSVVCKLRWSWELPIKLADVELSVFEVPAINVKGRKSKHYIVCNSVAQAIVESCRGMHDEYVFVCRRERPIKGRNVQHRLGYRSADNRPC